MEYAELLDILAKEEQPWVDKLPSEIWMMVMKKLPLRDLKTLRLVEGLCTPAEIVLLSKTQLSLNKVSEGCLEYGIDPRELQFSSDRILKSVITRLSNPRDRQLFRQICTRYPNQISSMDARQLSSDEDYLLVFILMQNVCQNLIQLQLRSIGPAISFDIKLTANLSITTLDLRCSLTSYQFMQSLIDCCASLSRLKVTENFYPSLIGKRITHLAYWTNYNPTNIDHGQISRMLEEIKWTMTHLVLWGKTNQNVNKEGYFALPYSDSLISLKISGLYNFPMLSASNAATLDRLPKLQTLVLDDEQAFLDFFATQLNQFGIRGPHSNLKKLHLKNNVDMELVKPMVAQFPKLERLQIDYTEFATWDYSYPLVMNLTETGFYLWIEVDSLTVEAAHFIFKFANMWEKPKRLRELLTLTINSGCSGVPGSPMIQQLTAIGALAPRNPIRLLNFCASVANTQKMLAFIHDQNIKVEFNDTPEFLL